MRWQDSGRDVEQGTLTLRSLRSGSPGADLAHAPVLVPAQVLPHKTEEPREPPLPVAGVPVLSRPILGSSCSRGVHRCDPVDC
jgi:hypothetical protein